MQPKFLYVMKTEDKDKLLKMGYNLIREDLVNKVFVFENKQVLTFDGGEHPLTRANVKYVLSDMITF